MDTAQVKFKEALQLIWFMRPDGVIHIPEPADRLWKFSPKSWLRRFKGSLISTFVYNEITTRLTMILSRDSG
jgi:hypothetical protein